MNTTPEQIHERNATVPRTEAMVDAIDNRDLRPVWPFDSGAPE